MTKLNYGEIEKKWQKYWQENGTNKTSNNFKNGKKKFYILDMFPYPSGEGLHVGHPKGYIATDVYSRMKKMQGYNVLHPMGWDAFGLPAEQFAIKNKINPNIATEKNVKRYKEQIEMLGINYDWDREINTTDPKYYKWTQWMFKQMYKDGLAHESFEPINWCPSCKTGLANEDLDGNVCERCGAVVEKKLLRQWVIKITDYADRLLEDLDKLNWEPHIKELQRNWIGKSEGSEMDFEVVDADKNNLKENKLRVFTTRADTLFGCTFMAISYTLAKEWIENGWEASEDIKKFIAKLEKEEKERALDFDMSKLEKEGVDTDIKAINPASGEEVPVYIANYILSDYGTGAIMAVPAHDERDYKFAKKYGIEIREVIKDKNSDSQESLFEGEGVLVNSEDFSGMNSEEARVKITEKVGGKIVSKYKLKDWVFARQRYWGEPFPIVFDENRKSYVVADKELPVILPNVENYEPTDTGESPLANIRDWVEVYGFINGDGEFESLDKSDKRAKLFYRETNTMPQWAGSSWYYLRYIDPQNDEIFVNKELEKNWSPVDFYVGGAEHATRHLIYARFWHKFFFDKGFVNYDEPFSKLQTVGLIMAEDGKKMSKRYNNVVNPDDVIKEFGCDAMRTYEMFMGPFDKAISWNTNSMAGVSRFLERIYSFAINNNFEENISESRELERVINETIKKVGEDIEDFKFNTAIAQMMICLNTLEREAQKGNKVSKSSFESFIKIISPFAVHISEEIWEKVLGKKESIHLSDWPKYNEAKMGRDEIEMSLQISGKFRGTFKTKPDLSDEEVHESVKGTDLYKRYILEDSQIKKVIVVKNRLINIVL